MTPPEKIRQHIAAHETAKLQLAGRTDEAALNRTRQADAAIADLKKQLPEEDQQPSLEEIATQEVLQEREFEALKALAHQTLEAEIEKTEGENNDPQTVLAAIENLRANT